VGGGEGLQILKSPLVSKGEKIGMEARVIARPNWGGGVGGFSCVGGGRAKATDSQGPIMQTLSGAFKGREGSDFPSYREKNAYGGRRRKREGGDSTTGRLL